MSEELQRKVDLKPCPFCGSTEVEAWKTVTHSGVTCIKCRAVEMSNQTIEIAIDLWNRRSADALGPERESQTTLSPCPFCGEKKISARKMEHWMGFGCPSCGVFVLQNPTKAGIEKWNRRAK